MVSAVALIHHGKGTLRLLRNLNFETPFAIQLFGKDPKEMALASKIAQDEFSCSLVDLNFACPARKVVNSGHGAALLKDPDLAVRIVEAVLKEISVPLTVKCRPGFHPPVDGKAPIFELAHRLSKIGISAITLHPRYASQGFKGEADWSMIEVLSKSLPIPIIGSGDITSAFQALERLKNSGASFIMLGRATRGRPWLFRECLELYQNNRLISVQNEERLSYAVKHARLIYSEMGDKAVYPLRTVLSWYLKELPNAASYRDRINHEEDFERQLSIVVEAFDNARLSKEIGGESLVNSPHSST
jgi:nifR3 family TIM-barrel protein